jgi:hypothetical protein
MTARFSVAVIAWFSPSDPRNTMPLTPNAMSTSAWRAVTARLREPSLCIWVVMAEKTPLQSGFIRVSWL